MPVPTKPISGEMQLQTDGGDFFLATYEGSYSLRHSPNPLSNSVHLDWEVEVKWGGELHGCAGTLMGKGMELHDLEQSANEAVEYGVQYLQRHQLWVYKP